MIYLVSKQQDLFKREEYSSITPNEAIEMLSKESILGLDTETQGLDAYEDHILSIQLGNQDFQIVWDCTSYPLIQLKKLLESPNILFLIHNFSFDAMFLLKEGIVVKNYFDTMIAERLLHNGYVGYTISLKSCAEKYCKIDMDKTVRGEIITKGLTPRVIVYAATDVTYLIPIYKAQLKELKRLDLVACAEFESKYTQCCAYFKLCGVKLDQVKWKTKMQKDQTKRDAALKKCNNWVLDYYKSHDGHDGLITLDLLISAEKNEDKANVLDPSMFDIKKVINTYNKVDPKFGICTYSKCELAFGFFNKNKSKYKSYIFKPRVIELNLFEEVPIDFSEKCQINWSSTDQLIPLFKLLGFNTKCYDSKTKKVKESVDKNLISRQKHISQLADLYLEYKEADTVCNAFGDKFLKALSKDGRIRGDWRPIGTDTYRMSCKGEVHGQKVNLQQLPSDAETRACFIAEPGNLWVSCDESGQESRIMASLANDKTMIEMLNDGDIHSYVARCSFKEIPNDYPLHDIKKNYHDLRQKAKMIEFTIAYGGDSHTIAQRLECSDEKGKEIYNDYMRAFPSVNNYQNYCKNKLKSDGYILMNNITRAKCFISEWDRLKSIQEEMQRSDFWERRKEDPELASDFRFYTREMAKHGRDAINYRIQNRGAGIFKLSVMLFFNYIVKHGWLNIVKFTIGAHDELNFEAPADIAYDLAKIYQKCILKAGKPFCPNINMESDVSYLKDGTLPNYWIH